MNIHPSKGGGRCATKRRREDSLMLKSFQEFFLLLKSPSAPLIFNERVRAGIAD